MLSMVGYAAIKTTKRVTPAGAKFPAVVESILDGGLDMLVGMFLHRLPHYRDYGKISVDVCQHIPECLLQPSILTY